MTSSVFSYSNLSLYFLVTSSEGFWVPLLHHSKRLNDCILCVVAVDAGLPLDLEELLRQRFSPNSPEHSLQSDVRSNINRYIVPCKSIFISKILDFIESEQVDSVCNSIFQKLLKWSHF